ncbi:MAG: hypothetical protein ACR2RL_18005 [Gammaproteobacteria bacterium]
MSALQRKPITERGRHSPWVSSWVLVAFDGCELTLPQHQVSALEPALGVRPSDEIDGQAGWLLLRAERCPVYCLTHELTPLQSPAPDRRLCVVLQFGSVSFGLLCTRVESIKGDDIRTFALPPVMQAPYAAAEGLAVYRARVIVQCSAQSVLRFVGYVNARDTAATDGSADLGEVFS